MAFQRDALLKTLDRVDILFANEPETLGLSGEDDLEAAITEMTGRVPLVAVTLREPTGA